MFAATDGKPRQARAIRRPFSLSAFNQAPNTALYSVLVRQGPVESESRIGESESLAVRSWSRQGQSAPPDSPEQGSEGSCYLQLTLKRKNHTNSSGLRTKNILGTGMINISLCSPAWSQTCDTTPLASQDWGDSHWAEWRMYYFYGLSR